MHRLSAVLVLLVALIAPAFASVSSSPLDIAPRSSVVWTPWVEMTHVSAVSYDLDHPESAPAPSIATATLPAFPGNAARVRKVVFEYSMSSLDAQGYEQRVDNYGAENMSPVLGATYDGTYGVDYRLRVAGLFGGGVAMYHGMCGGAQLSTFDGECDFGAPGEMVVGGSGHNAGLGFPTYRERKELPGSLAFAGELPVELAISSFYQFDWNGSPNWVSGGWLDGEKLTVKVRAGYVVGAAH